MSATNLYDSIIASFGCRFSVVMMPNARRYRVFPLGTFHYFDWQKSETTGISIGTCPQIVSSEQAEIGVRVGDVSRILPFAEGETFASMRQSITPLKTIISACDPDVPLALEFVFCSAFYPESFEYSCIPAYSLDVSITNTGDSTIIAEVFFGISMQGADSLRDGLRAVAPLEFPDGIDHAGIKKLTFEQIIAGDQVRIEDGKLVRQVSLSAGETQMVHFYHAGYIAEPTLNRRGDLLKFGYTDIWEDARQVLDWCRSAQTTIRRKSDFFESTMLASTIPPELKNILSAAFKGLAANAWWAEDDWFSIMEIGAYHSTLDVDYQLALFFFQYWIDLIKPMLNQWADFYRAGSGYMAHDVGQHLEANGNRYGGPDSAMKVEENCNYLLLLHHYWRSSADTSIFVGKAQLIRELVNFLIASDTDRSGLPNRYADNTNDWGSGLITASEEQSYHAVRLLVTYSAVMQMADHWNDHALIKACQEQISLINQTLDASWLGDHYPIAISDKNSYQHYSMWTTHGLLYGLRNGMDLSLDLDKLRIDLISSTQRTLREHGCVHSTVDVRGWLTQNLWRDAIAAYLGVDLSANFRRYLGHGEYVSYEDTSILEVANELMVVPGATAEHSYAGETHENPMVDGHPRPACGFGLLYALAGVQFDAIEQVISLSPVIFPLRIAITHLADWENEQVVWLTFNRSIPNQDQGWQAPVIHMEIENEALLQGRAIQLKTESK